MSDLDPGAKPVHEYSACQPFKRREHLSCGIVVFRIDMDRDRQLPLKAMNDLCKLVLIGTAND